MTVAPPAPLPRLSLGVTGHRETNAVFSKHREHVEQTLEAIFSRIDEYVASEEKALGQLGTTRLNNLLASGFDQIAAAAAYRRDWELVAPLPFGRNLNLAVNALPRTLADGEALLRGDKPEDPEVAERAETIQQSYKTSRLFELAEQDEEMTRLFLNKLQHPVELYHAHAFSAGISERVAIAGRVMIEQADFVIAVWDGDTQYNIGGTGHTIAVALSMGTPVLWIDPACAENWRILATLESLLAGTTGFPDRYAGLATLVRKALHPEEVSELREGAEALGAEAWHSRSSRFWTAYRRVEALFGGEGRPFRSLVQHYEKPEEVETGTAVPLLEIARPLCADDPDFIKRMLQETSCRHAWADGISSRLSDYYRGGMIANFIASVVAVGAGIAYQPLGFLEEKWFFALIEFFLLCSILLNVWLAARLRWHKRWFETRRVAEYFRHSWMLLLLGVARSPGRWPRGTDTSWPEYYARHGLRAPGLPRLVITPSYLRETLGTLVLGHVVYQRDYHVAKAKRLTTVHHRLDRISEWLFLLAVISVGIYLVLAGLAAVDLVPHQWPHANSKIFTFLGVMFPTLGATIAGIRYFGDFERFAAISDVTAEKLDAVADRIQHLLAAPDHKLTYSGVSQLVHNIDDIVVSEIENWQAVFRGKHISVPV